MPDYTKAVSDDTPCVNLRATLEERDWLTLHAGHRLHLIEQNDALMLECLDCDCYLGEFMPHGAYQKEN